MRQMKHYDCLVIGSGPAGHKGAIQAAKLGKEVAVVEKNAVVGGVMVNTGTIPSKALREAALYLTGTGRRELFGEVRRVKQHVTISDLASISQHVMQNEWRVIQDQFYRNGVELLWGKAHFEGPNLVQIERDGDSELVTADRFLLAIGTRPAMPKTVPFNGRNIFNSDGLLQIKKLPKSMIVVGGGVVGTEYACIMATLGVHVTLIEGRDRVLNFLDHEIGDAFHYFMRDAGTTLRLGEKVECIEELPAEGDHPAMVQATLESGKRLRAEVLLYATGRQGLCGQLGLDNVGLDYDDRERLHVNEHYQTNVEHIYAAGDVIGFPALASTSMEQGRRAICHAFNVPVDNLTKLFPYGIYAVPEISMVGKTEEQLTAEGTPYETGIANYREIARAQLLGDETGLLKLLVHQDNHKILGVHAIGSGATEFIHIGQAVIAFGGTVEYFLENVFNYPTLAEAYKVAAYNAVNKLSLLDSPEVEATEQSKITAHIAPPPGMTSDA